jgi:hypothetical protein
MMALVGWLIGEKFRIRRAVEAKKPARRNNAFTFRHT